MDSDSHLLDQADPQVDKSNHSENEGDKALLTNIIQAATDDENSDKEWSNCYKNIRLSDILDLSLSTISVSRQL